MLKQQLIVILLLFSFIVLFSACTSHVAMPKPTETTIPEKETTPPPTSAVEEAKDSTSTPVPTTEPFQQTNDIDMVKDILGLIYVADGYDVECVLPSAFGMPGQIALLPNGDLVLTDGNYKRISILSKGNIHTLVEGNDVKIRTVAAIPDGRVCYPKRSGQIILVDPNTGAEEVLGQTSPGDGAQALAADNEGNVYAATFQRNLYRFTPDGKRVTLATNLPYDQGNHITDIDVAADGTVYVAGWKLLLAVDENGVVTTILDDLHDEPTWCNIDPDGNIYIEDLSSGVRRIDPKNGKLSHLESWPNPHGDFLALSNDEFVVISMGTDAICTYKLSENELDPIYINAVNSFAFAASSDERVFLATPSLTIRNKGTMLKSHIVCLSNGITQDLTKLTFDNVYAADVDKENLLYLAADNGFYTVEATGEVTSIMPKSPPGFLGNVNMAVSPSGLLYCISTNHNDSIRVWTVDKKGETTFLPISFNRASFGNTYKVSDARIDIGNDGRLAIIVTALGSNGQGPFYQRVYQANADGTDLRLITNFDSARIGGMVDIAAGPDNDVFVSTPQNDSRRIYRIDRNNTVSQFIVFNTGRDPKSMDVDSNGNVWFCTTVGVFKVTRSK